MRKGKNALLLVLSKGKTPPPSTASLPNYTNSIPVYSEQLPEHRLEKYVKDTLMEGYPLHRQQPSPYPKYQESQ